MREKEAMGVSDTESKLMNVGREVMDGWKLTKRVDESEMVGYLSPDPCTHLGFWSRPLAIQGAHGIVLLGLT
jgi:hypothetical protein